MRSAILTPPNQLHQYPSLFKWVFLISLPLPSEGEGGATVSLQIIVVLNWFEELTRLVPTP